MNVCDEDRNWGKEAQVSGGDKERELEREVGRTVLLELPELLLDGADACRVVVVIVATSVIRLISILGSTGNLEPGLLSLGVVLIIGERILVGREPLHGPLGLLDPGRELLRLRTSENQRPKAMKREL